MADIRNDAINIQNDDFDIKTIDNVPVRFSNFIYNDIQNMISTPTRQKATPFSRKCIRLKAETLMESSGISILFTATFSPSAKVKSNIEVIVKLMRKRDTEKLQRELEHLNLLDVTCPGYFVKPIRDTLLASDEFEVYRDDEQVDNNYGDYIGLILEKGSLNLDQFLKQRKNKLSYANKVQIVDRLTEIVAKAHENDIVLLDFKASNIVYFMENQLQIWKCIDLDGALHVDTPLCDAAFMCTPSYMAPELFDNYENKLAKKKMDVWSLGMVVFELFHDQNCSMWSVIDIPLDEIKYKIKEPHKVLSIQNLIDDNVNLLFKQDALRRYLKKCLCIDPSHRFTSAQLLSSHLLRGDHSFSKSTVMGAINKGFGHVNARIDTVDANLKIVMDKIGKGFDKLDLMLNNDIIPSLDRTRSSANNDNTFDLLVEMSKNVKCRLQSTSDTDNILELKNEIHAYADLVAQKTANEAVKKYAIEMKFQYSSVLEELTLTKEVLGKLCTQSENIENEMIMLKMQVDIFAKELREKLNAMNGEFSVQKEMLETLLRTTHNVPTLMVLLPEVKKGLERFNPIHIIKQKARLHFLCSHTLQLVRCGPEGKGYPVSVTKEWLKKAAPYLEVGLAMLRIALHGATGITLPLANIQSVTADTISSTQYLQSAFTLMKDEEATLYNSLDELMKGRQINSKGISDMLSAENTRGAYETIKLFLDKEDPALDFTGLIKCTANGKTAWIRNSAAVIQSFKQNNGQRLIN